MSPDTDVNVLSLCNESNLGFYVAMYSHEQMSCCLSSNINDKKVHISHSSSDFMYSDILHNSINGYQTLMHLKFSTFWI